METMKRPAENEFSPVEIPQPEEKRKRMDTKLCTPFCEPDCPGQHNKWIMSLVNLKESSNQRLNEWKESLDKEKDAVDFNLPLDDSVPSGRGYPLLHWAAMLGRVKALKWLLSQNFIHLMRNLENTANEDTKSSQLSDSNETALFSAARFLHEGVKTRETHPILKTFANITDEFLNHDARVLLVQEECSKNTVLHLCAQGEEGSSAPFLGYLKRVLAKLQEYHAKNHTPPASLRDILEKTNGEGDTFLHIIAKTKTIEEAEDIRKYAKEKLESQENFGRGKSLMDFLEDVKNDDRKTARDILKERQKEDPDLNQTGSQNSQIISPEVQPSSEKGQRVEEISESPTASPILPRLIENGPSSTDIPRRIFSDFASDGTGFPAPSSPQSQPGDRDDKEPEDVSVKNCSVTERGLAVEPSNSQPAGHADINTEAKEVVTTLMHQTELELNEEKGKLVEARRELKECQDRMKQLLQKKQEKKDAIERLEKEVKTKEDRLKSCKDLLSNLETR